jgi:hypothetical protein
VGVDQDRVLGHESSSLFRLRAGALVTPLRRAGQTESTGPGKNLTIDSCIDIIIV